MWYNSQHSTSVATGVLERQENVDVPTSSPPSRPSYTLPTNCSKILSKWSMGEIEDSHGSTLSLSFPHLYNGGRGTVARWLLNVRPHRRQPTRLPRPWDSPGKNTGVGCHFLLQSSKVKVKSLSNVRPSATPWTTAYQAPLSMGFARQEYWSGLPLPSPNAKV